MLWHSMLVMPVMASPPLVAVVETTAITDQAMGHGMVAAHLLVDCHTTVVTTPLI